VHRRGDAGLEELCGAVRNVVVEGKRLEFPGIPDPGFQGVV